MEDFGAVLLVIVLIFFALFVGSKKTAVPAPARRGVQFDLAQNEVRSMESLDQQMEQRYA